MYERTFWLNHVVDQEGRVIQQGTLLDQQHFNNAEVGISDAHLAASIMLQQKLQNDRAVDSSLSAITSEIKPETGTAYLQNTETYPFNNSEQTIALETVRSNTDYTVEATVVGVSGSPVRLPGEIRVFDKAINGFKMAFDGSARYVSVKYIVKGGFMA